MMVCFGEERVAANNHQHFLAVREQARTTFPLSHQASASSDRIVASVARLLDGCNLFANRYRTRLS